MTKIDKRTKEVFEFNIDTRRLTLYNTPEPGWCISTGNLWRLTARKMEKHEVQHLPSVTTGVSQIIALDFYWKVPYNVA